MISCTCLVCKNLAKRAKLECCPTEPSSEQATDDKYSESCIPTLMENINKRYDRDVKTSDLYRTLNIPERFDRTCTLNGYGSQYRVVHPEFRTSSSEYGWMPPNAHTVPHSYYPRSNEFSQLLSKTGMYRNYSLNTVMDKSRV